MQMNRKKHQYQESSTYFATLGNMNRYLFESKHTKANIKQLNIVIPLMEFLRASDFANKTKLKDSIKIKSMLFFYILINKMPDIVFHQARATKSSKGKNEGEFSLFFNTVTKAEIAKILSELPSYYFSKKAYLPSLKHAAEEFIYTSANTMHIPASAFYSSNDLFKAKITDIDLKKVKVTLHATYH